jgi:hypothetical protein
MRPANFKCCYFIIKKANAAKESIEVLSSRNPIGQYKNEGQANVSQKQRPHFKKYKTEFFWLMFKTFWTNLYSRNAVQGNVVRTT